MPEKENIVRAVLFSELSVCSLFIAHNTINVKADYTSTAKSLWNSSFFSQNLDPIDAIVVPLHEEYPNLGSIITSTESKPHKELSRKHLLSLLSESDQLLMNTAEALSILSTESNSFYDKAVALEGDTLPYCFIESLFETNKKSLSSSLPNLSFDTSCIEEFIESQLESAKATEPELNEFFNQLPISAYNHYLQWHRKQSG